MKYMKKMKDLHNINTPGFGLLFDRSVTSKELMRHCKKNMRAKELEDELNILAKYCFNDNREINFNEFRNFPYVIHKNKDTNFDYVGLLKNYTSADYYFIYFIKTYLRWNKRGYSFPNISYIRSITKKVEIKEEAITEMPADIVLGKM